MKIRMIKKLTRIAIVSLFALFTKSGYGQINASLSVTNVKCFGNNTGEIKVNNHTSTANEYSLDGGIWVLDSVFTDEAETQTDPSLYFNQ